MTAVASGLALALGALLYFAEEQLLGILVAMPVPKAYFDFFGTHKIVALCLEEALLVALPAWLLALAWGLAATRLIRPSPYRITGWLITGLVMAWSVSLLWFAWSDPLSGRWAFVSWLVPPIWGVLTAAAAPWGLLVAALLARRHGPTSRRMAMRPSN